MGWTNDCRTDIAVLRGTPLAWLISFWKSPFWEVKIPLLHTCHSWLKFSFNCQSIIFSCYLNIWLSSLWHSHVIVLAHTRRLILINYWTWESCSQWAVLSSLLTAWVTCWPQEENGHGRKQTDSSVWGGNLAICLRAQIQNSHSVL